MSKYTAEQVWSERLIVINNYVYDVSKYIDNHPGGADIIDRNRGTDATEQFEQIGHSKRALQLLEQYRVGSIDNHEKHILNGYSVTNEANRNITNSDKDYFEKRSVSDTGLTLKRVSERLITHEDPMYFHKIFGCLALVSMIVRSLYLMITGKPTMLYPTYINHATLFVHFALCMSSLIFHIPLKRYTSGNSFEYEEMRLHSIIFSCRSMSGIILGWLGLGTAPVMLLNVFLWHGLADLASYIYHDPDNGTTVRGKSTDKKPDIVRYGNTFASVSQFFAIGGMLRLGEVTCSQMTLDAQYLVMIPIQISVFLLTLYKKGLISKITQLVIYLLTLVPLYVLLWGKPIYVICCAVIAIGRMRFRIDKYILYIIATILSISLQYVSRIDTSRFIQMGGLV